MHIATFVGSNADMGDAIEEAETAAQETLNSLGPSEVVSVQVQSFVDRHGNGTFAGEHTCFHIITVLFD